MTCWVLGVFEQSGPRINVVRSEGMPAAQAIGLRPFSMRLLCIWSAAWGNICTGSVVIDFTPLHLLRSTGPCRFLVDAEMEDVERGVA